MKREGHVGKKLRTQLFSLPFTCGQMNDPETHGAKDPSHLHKRSVTNIKPLLFQTTEFYDRLFGISY